MHGVGGGEGDFEGDDFQTKVLTVHLLITFFNHSPFASKKIILLPCVQFSTLRWNDLLLHNSRSDLVMA